MEFIQNAALFIANMIFFGIIDFALVGVAFMIYDWCQLSKEDEPDAETD